MKAGASRVARVKAHYGDASMSDAALVRCHLAALVRPQSVHGIVADTGLSPAVVASLLREIGARRHPRRDPSPASPAPTWSVGGTL